MFSVLSAVLPIFALANAGIYFGDLDGREALSGRVALGVFAGLLVGKVLGVVGFTWLSHRMGIARMPVGMTMKNLLGLGFLAAIGFTMSLFVTGLAFDHPEYEAQAKLAIFMASILGGLVGYRLLRSAALP